MFTIIKKYIESRKVDKEVDRLLKKHTFYKTEESIQIKLDREMESLRERNRKIIAIKSFLSYVFLYPLSKILKLISYVSRVGIMISVITFFIGLYDLFKYVNKESVDIKMMIVFLVAPFMLSLASYVFGAVSKKLWND